MNSLRVRTNSLLICLSIVFTLTAAIAQDSPNIEIKTTHISGNLYMLTGIANVAVLTGDDGVLVVDTEMATNFEGVKTGISEITDKPIRLVLNTHYHFDHTGGNEKLAEGGALIVAHDNVRARMSTQQYLKVMNLTHPSFPKIALPVLTFSDSIHIHFNGEEIHAFHVAPAHSDGDVIIQFRHANVVQMGDLLFTDRYPFIDVDNDGSVKGMLDALDLALVLFPKDTKFIPGHGPLCDRSGILEFKDLLITVRNRVRKQMDDGQTLEEIIASKPTAEFDAKWKARPGLDERLIRVMYTDCSKHKGGDIE
jgi:cyclase